ncbi:MAG: HAMP domain-containing protein [Phycisphaerales bacterium]|nr:HAMP domain-containing protein [Phycisphaerales bacterium]
MIGRPGTIRARLALWFAAALALVLVVVAAGVYLIVRAGVLGEVAARVRRDLETTAAFVSANPGDVAEFAEFNPHALVLVLKGNQIEHQAAAWETLGLPTPAQLVTDGADRLWETPRHDHYRIAVTTVSTGERTFTIAVAADEEPARRSIAAVSLMLGASFPAVLVLAGAGGYWLAGRMLAPIRRMAEAAERISGDRLGERLPVENPADEFGRLATITNRSLDQLEETVDRQRRFTADASHEIRTPLTAIRSAGEVALRSEHSPEEYRETIGSMLEGVTRLTSLTDRLLLLARADAGTHAVRPERIDAAAIAREVVDLYAPAAEDKGIGLVFGRDGPWPITVDPVLFRQALVNLVDNAVKYTPAGGRVEVSAALANGTVRITVADTGPGIPPEHHPRIFERFYRVDPARSPSAQAGTGLGLAIVKWSVEACGGTVAVASPTGRGSTFTLTFPAPPGTGPAAESHPRNTQ